jgi:tetratricopeptide (TPR) repeat protein
MRGHHTASVGPLLFVGALLGVSLALAGPRDPPREQVGERALTARSPAALEGKLEQQARALERLAGRLDSLDKVHTAAVEAARTSAESSARMATLVISLVGALVVIAGLLGWRSLRDLRSEMQKQRDEAAASAEDTKKCAQQAGELLEKIRQALSRAEEEAEKLRSIDVTKELEPQVRARLEALGRRLDLLELLGQPLGADAWFARGNAYYREAQYERAVQCYDRAIQIRPDYAEAHMLRGVALAALGRNEEALAGFDRAVHTRPDSAKAHCLRGVVLGELGRNEEELAAFDRAVQIRPDYADAHYNRAYAHSRLGMRPQALADLGRAIELDPKCRDMAKTQQGFESLRDDPEFRRLVGL